jgi:class 3 adenylate cyclase
MPQNSHFAAQDQDICALSWFGSFDKGYKCFKILSDLISGMESIDLNILSSLTGEPFNLSVVLKNLQNQSSLHPDWVVALRRQVLSIKPHSLEIYHVLADWILQVGEPLIAYDLVAEGLQQWPKDYKLRQLMALALLNSGAVQRAHQLLLQLQQEGHQNAQTNALLGRIYKDIAIQTQSIEQKQAYYRLAYESYCHAYTLEPGWTIGINAATLALILSEPQRATSLAEEIKANCLQELEQMQTQHQDPYWYYAALGEIALIQGDWENVYYWYSQANQAGQGRLGNLSSTYRNARLILEFLRIPTDRVRRCFQIPSVLVFAGHMIDHPQRSQPRFPLQLEPLVSEAIQNQLERLDAKLGYCSAACGSDILFAEALLARGGEVRIILPFAREEFIRDSVLPAGADWVNRFDQVIEQATEVIIVSQRQQGDRSLAYEYSNQILYGLAQMRANQLETTLTPLAVWNGKPGDGPGGTATMVQYWRNQGHQVQIVDLTALLQQAQVQALQPSIPKEQAPFNSTDSVSTVELTREIRAMLFADVVQFSRLGEDQIAAYVQHFLGAIADLSVTSYLPVHRNTWGDAIYFVFASVREAGCFALELQNLMQKTSWVNKGLPEHLNVRIALHAGPVYRCMDPVTGRFNYVGSHVNHAARIEPVTPPGQVYASQAFAALVVAEGIAEFTCEYVGRMSYAKGYGTFPTYFVQRRIALS